MVRFLKPDPVAEQIRQRMAAKRCQALSLFGGIAR